MQSIYRTYTTLDNHIWKVSLFVSVTNINHDHTILISNHNEAHKTKKIYNRKWIEIATTTEKSKLQVCRGNGV